MQAGQPVSEGMGSWAQALGRLCKLHGQGQRWAAKQDHEGGVWVLAGCVDRENHVGGVGLPWVCWSGCVIEASAADSYYRQTGREFTVCGRGLDKSWGAVVPRLARGVLPTLSPCTFGYFMSRRKVWRSVVPTVSVPPKSRLCVVISRVSMWKWLRGSCFSYRG